jgi:hypothetical protein
MTETDAAREAASQEVQTSPGQRLLQRGALRNHPFFRKPSMSRC